MRKTEKLPRKAATFGRSAGAVLFARIGRTAEELAAEFRVSRSHAGFLLVGRKKPSDILRRRIFDRYPQIEPMLWDLPPTALEAPPVPTIPSDVPPVDAPPTLSAYAQAVQLKRIVDRIVHQVENDPSITLRERMRVIQAAAVTNVQLGKVTGENREVSEAKIVNHPVWRGVVDALRKALTPWPDAMLAAGEALMDLEKHSVG